MAVANELFGGHAPVGAVAVEEEVGAEAAGVFVEVKARVFGGELIEDFTEAVKAVVVSEDVVDFEVGELDDQFVEPSLGGFEGFFLVAEGAPAEVESVAVEDESIGFIQLFFEFGDEFFSDRSVGKKVEV